MKKTYIPMARNERLVIQEMLDELLIYDLDTNKAYCLNDTAYTVWKACDGQNSIAEIAKTFDKGNEDLVWLAIDQLHQNDLLVNQTSLDLNGRSRRELIKKVGLASVIALPVVASLVAPSSALAGGSCTCINPGDCITQTSCPSTVNCNGSRVCAP